MTVPVSRSNISSVEPPKKQLSKSMDVESEQSNWLPLVVNPQLSVSAPAFSGRERTLSIGGGGSPRSYEKISSSQPKLSKSGSKINRRVFKELKKSLVEFNSLTIADLSRLLTEDCLKIFKNTQLQHQENFVEWLYQQVTEIKQKISEKPHYRLEIETNLKRIKSQLDKLTQTETSDKLISLQKLLQTIISGNYGSFTDFAIFCKTNALQYEKKVRAIFYKAIAGDKKLAEPLLDFFAKWSRDFYSSQNLALAFNIDYLTRMSFEVFSGSIRDLDKMKISLSDVHRHLIVDSKLIIKKIVVNEVPINDLDLFENKEERILKEDEISVYYGRVLHAICNTNKTDVDQFMNGTTFSEMTTPLAIKIGHLMQSGTINFWSLAHEKILSLFPGRNQFRLASEGGTTWNIQSENEKEWSLTQIKNYFVERDENKIVSLNVRCLTQFDFEKGQVKSSLTIPLVKPKENLSDLEQTQLVELVGLQL